MTGELPPSQPDIDELIRQFEASNRARNLSTSTIKGYTETLALYARYLKANNTPGDLSQFTPAVVRNYILHLQQKPRFAGHPYTPQQDSLLSPTTVQDHVRVLKVFSSWQYAEGYTLENRLKNVKLPKAPHVFIQPLTSQETKQSLSSIDQNSPTGARMYTILVTDLDTGLRANEIVTATLPNTNLEGGFIKVRGKGSKERIVPIGRYTQRTLWHYIEKVRPDPVGGCDNLFLSQDGTPMTVNSLKLAFSRLAKTSGVERLHVHLCRHTFAINYLLNGGDIFSLKEILGHTTLEMVNRYLHFTNAQITAQHHKYSPMDKFTSEN
jgi:site-specific recombinase XerD